MNAARALRKALIASVCSMLIGASAAQPTGAQVQAPAAEPRTLVILGASYVKGWGTPALPGFNQVINRGVGGEETGGMLARFETDVVAADPAAVLIWGHVNNISRSGTDGVESAKRAAREHYDEMVRRAKAAGIEVILATEVPWTEARGLIATLHGWYAWLVGKTSYATYVSGHVEDVNRHIRALAARENLRLLDFGREFAREDGTRNPEYTAEDASHISAAGYAALTAYATRELRRAK